MPVRGGGASTPLPPVWTPALYPYPLEGAGALCLSLVPEPSLSGGVGPEDTRWPPVVPVWDVKIDAPDSSCPIWFPEGGLGCF